MAISTDINEFLVQELFAIYIDAEEQMLDKISKRMKKKVYDPKGWTEEKSDDVTRLRQEVKKLVEDKGRIVKSKLSKGIIDAYVAGGKSASKDLNKVVTAISDFVPGRVERWILDAHNLIDGTSFQIMRNVDDAYRKIIADSGTMAMLGVDTPQQAAQRALNKFAAQGITSFVDKIGRRWELASYVEMATRTTMARAALQGHVDRMHDLGHDLMKVSSIGTTCDICAPWQGKVISVSGKDPNYPSLDSANAAGLFHPNCKHTLMAYFPEITDGPEPQKGNNEWLYNKTQEQRYNERQIRKWKRVEIVALDPASKSRAEYKVKYWQAKQRRLIDDTGLRRNYKREGVMNRVGDASKASPDLFKSLPSYESIPVKPKAAKPKTVVKTLDAKSQAIDFSKIPTLKHFDEHVKAFVDKNKAKFGEENTLKKALSNVQAVVDKAVLRTRVPNQDIMKKILGDGKFKTQMESGRSNGLFSPSIRKEATRKMFGADVDKMLDSDFEYYGYAWSGDIADDVRRCNATHYGNVVVEWKPEIKNRATFTIDDSLGPCNRGNMIPSRFEKITPSWELYKNTTQKLAKLKPNATVWDICEETGVSYVEVQYHGGCSVNDIESVIIDLRYDNINEELVKELKSRGIKVGEVTFDANRKTILKWL